MTQPVGPPRGYFLRRADRLFTYFDTAQGHLSRRTQARYCPNADGKVTTYSYDAANLLTAKTEPGGLTTSYTYDAAGRPAVTTKPDGSTSTSSYDDSGLLTRTHSSISGSTDTTYTYDAAGQRTSMVDASGSSSYEYNPTGQLSQETNGAGATTGYTYDDIGQLTSIAYPGANKTVTYAYDNAGNMPSVTDWNGHTTTFGYTADDQLSQRSAPNGVSQTSTFDAVGRATEISTAAASDTLGQFAYAYDANGNLTSSATGGSAFTASSRTHTYDSLGQLATTTGGTTAATYSSTSAGQISTTTAGAALGYNAKQELTSLSPPTGASTSFTYDGNGSRISASTPSSGFNGPVATEYAYTPAGSLASVTLPDSSTISYSSNGDGLRQSRTDAGATSQFTWDNAGTLSLLLNDGEHSYIYGPSSAPVEQISNKTGTTEYLFGDVVGSTRLITDETGVVIGSNTYDDYGKLTQHTGTGQSNMGYTGNWTDAATNLVYLRARDYDPATAQFMTVDPALDQTHQPYGYVANTRF